MSKSELENFVNKFHQLRQAGYTAHLDVDTHAGQSWVGLRVMLGPAPMKYAQKKQHRSPSYLRRQERRKAASYHTKGMVIIHQQIFTTNVLKDPVGFIWITSF